MSQARPAKLVIPIKKDERYELTINPDESKADFEQKVLENCPGVKKFEINSENETLGQITCNTFKINVNGTNWKVYPNFGSLVTKTYGDQVNWQQLRDLQESNVSMKLSHQLTLHDYYNQFLLLHKATGKKELTKAEIEDLFNQSIV